MGDKKGLGRGVDLSPALTRSIISSVNFRCGDEGEREGEEGDGLSGVPGTGEGRGPWSWSLVLLRELEANRDPSSCLRCLSFLRLFPGGGRWSSSSLVKMPGLIFCPSKPLPPIVISEAGK